MSTVLLIIYAVWIAVNLVALIRTAKINVNKNWLVLLSSEAAAMMLSLALMMFFDHLPGGMLGGFTYMGEVLFSMGSAMAQAGLLVISVITLIIRKCIFK